MEMDHNWTGLLIEASPESFQKLMTRNRKAWSSNVCLSLMPYPTRVCYNIQREKFYLNLQTFIRRLYNVNRLVLLRGTQKSKELKPSTMLSKLTKKKKR